MPRRPLDASRIYLGNDGIVYGTAQASPFEGEQIYRSGDTIVFKAGGTDRATVGTAFDVTGSITGGTIGSGTTTPTRQFHSYRNNSATTVDQGRFEQDGAGDVYVTFSLTGLQAMSMGLDNSDGDRFNISDDNNLHTNVRLSIDTSGNVTVGGAQTLDDFGIYSSDAGATGPGQQFYHDSASPTADDVVGYIDFYGEDLAGNKHQYGRIRGVIIGAANSNEAGKIDLQVSGVGSNQTGLSVRGPASSGIPYCYVPAYIEFADAIGNTPGSVPAIFAATSGGTIEMFVQNDGGTDVQLTSHREPPIGFDPTIEMPWSFTHSNKLIGKRAVVDMSRLVKAVESLAGMTLTWIETLPTADRRTVANWRAQRIESMTESYVETELRSQPEIEVDEATAWTTAIETQRQSVTQQISHYVLDSENKTRRLVTEEVNREVDAPTGRMVNTLKPGIRLDEKTGKYLRARRREDVAVPTFDPQPRKWIADRLPGR